MHMQFSYHVQLYANEFQNLAICWKKMYISKTDTRDNTVD